MGTVLRRDVGERDADNLALAYGLVGAGSGGFGCGEEPWRLRSCNSRVSFSNSSPRFGFQVGSLRSARYYPGRSSGLLLATSAPLSALLAITHVLGLPQAARRCVWNL